MTETNVDDEEEGAQDDSKSGETTHGDVDDSIDGNKLSETMRLVTWWS